MGSTIRTTLILASSSPRRQELIQSLRFPVEIMVSDVDEDTDPELSPGQIVETLSARKAHAIYRKIKGSTTQGIIIGCDTIVVLDGQVMNKPQDDQDALRMLRLLQGNTHQVFSGVTCIETASGTQLTKHRVTAVSMKQLSDSQIERYILSGEPRDKAGAYAIQGLGATIVESITGDYFNVVGLPLSLLSDMLQHYGLEII